MQDDTSAGQKPATCRRALEHMAAVVDAVPSYAAVDQRVWLAVIDSWSRPLPTNRTWRSRHGSHRRRAGRSEWHDPQLPDRADSDNFAAIDREVASARAAWSHLYHCGLVDRADPEDLVTATLRPQLPAEAA